MLSWLSRRGRKIDIFRAFDSFWRELEGPGDDERNWESNHNQRNDQAHHPVRYFQERKDLGCDLNEDPRHNRIGDRNLINIAPLQLREEGRLLAHPVRDWRRLRPANTSAQVRQLAVLHLPSPAAYGAAAPVRESVRRRRSCHSEVLHPKQLDDSHETAGAEETLLRG